MAQLFSPAVERRGVGRQPTGRRWVSVVLASVALAAVLVVLTARNEDIVSLDEARGSRPSLQQMLDESVRLQQEGDKDPTFTLPAAQPERVTSGPHALDWRKGDSDPETRITTTAAYKPPPGSIDRVDDPVGDEDGWVRMGDRAFRVTRKSDGSMDHLDLPGDARIRPVSDGWEVEIPESQERDRYNDRNMMRKAPERVRREDFSPEQWAAIRLHRKFFKADANRFFRRDPSWVDTDKEMDRAGWNADNSEMPVRASKDWDEDWTSAQQAGVRDRYYHWVAGDGRTDTDGAPSSSSARVGSSGNSDDASLKGMRGTSGMVKTADDSKPPWLVVRRSIKDGTIKVERDMFGDIKHIAVPASAMVEANGSDGWKISFPDSRVGGVPSDAAASGAGDTALRVADAQDPANNEKVVSATAQWASVSAPGDMPGEDAKVKSAKARASGGDSAQDALNGQAVDRAAYGISERAQPTGVVAGRWESNAKPIVDVYAPNEDPFYCMDGTESSICGTKGRPEREHDYSLGWGRLANSQKSLTSENSGDRPDELGKPSARQGAQLTGYRQTPASADPYKYVRDGNYAKILRREDEVMGSAAGRSTDGEMTAGKQEQDREEMTEEEQRSMESMKAMPGSAVRGVELQKTVVTGPRTIPPLPYKVRAPYDGSLIKIGYPNMRGGMRGEDGELLPYDDRSGAGNNLVSHKDWASDVWARPSPWGVRDVRDSLNRNEEGGARRLVDERGFHEYEAGNRGFHEARPDDSHDADDSDESSRLRVDQFDVAGDEEGRRRETRGGDGNADEFDSSRPAAKADYDPDMRLPPRSRSMDGDTRHIYMPFEGRAAWQEADLADRVKRDASLRIADRADRRRRGEGRREEELRKSDSDSSPYDRREHGDDARSERSRVESYDDSRREHGADGGRSWDRDETSMGWDGRKESRADGRNLRPDRERDLSTDYKEERRQHDVAERSNRRREQEKGYDRARDKRKREREAALLQRWARRAARDSAMAASHESLASGNGHLEELSQAPMSPAARAEAQRVNEIAEAKLKAQATHRNSKSVASLTAMLAEEHVNKVAARKLAAEARLAHRHADAAGVGSASAATGTDDGGMVAKISKHVKSWLGVYQAHDPLPPRTSLSAGVDAVDDYNKRALAHILSSAHGADAPARLTARQAYIALKEQEHPQQFALKRSLKRSASLRASLGDYLGNYGSGPVDAAAANGLNL